MVAGRLARVVAASLIVLITMATGATAQITTGSVAGTVKDTSGGVIPGATVTLISETKGTRSSPVVTSATGDFVFVNVAPDTYTIDVAMPSFKTLKRAGITVNPGSRTSVGDLPIEVGGTTEVITVTGETPMIQATTGERSFTVTTAEVENLPTASRSFIALALLAPGVSGTVQNAVRTGGGGDTNIMMDGVSIIDTGSNRPLLQMNVESIQEVKILTSNYQAEYGRSSGLQITAVTKSGTNRIRGSIYDVERNSDWNPNSKTNKLNGNSKNTAKERDFGYSISGPIGKPGGNNKIFFFYSQEFAPRTAGNDTRRFRMPTALERQGDFSETTDNLGALYPYIKDPRLSGTCNNTNTAANPGACFITDGKLGKIPANMLYQPGLNILNMFPMPNIANPGTNNYNHEIIRPEETILAWQPGLKFDYQASSSLRASWKYSGWTQRMQTINGSLPGFNDSRMQRPKVSSWTVSVNYSLTPTMFLEGTYGRSQNDLAGCALAQEGTGPTFCTAGLPMNDASYRNAIGLAALPMLYPNANVLNPDYYATKALNGMDPAPPAWVNGDFVKTPQFTWGGRISNAPPNTPFPGYFNINATQDVSISLTKVTGQHTFKMGYYQTHSYKAEQATDTNSFGTINFQQDAVGTNPFDTSFGFANAAIGTFSSFSQAQNYVEGNYVYDNIEGYIQDNWKVNSRLTLDYGLRLVHQKPQYDKLKQAANFLPDEWLLSAAPALYKPGCTITVAPGTACPAANRQAQNPLTGAFLGPNTTNAFGTLVAGSGSPTNGLFLPGQGIVDTTYTFPALGLAPRFGMAYDVSQNQSLIVRGGMGLFFDRPFGNSVISMAGNPPASKQVTTRYSQLQSLGSGGLTTQAPPALNTIQYDPKLPSSTQWNAGVQMLLPWKVTIDAEYVGQHSFNTVRTVNINAVDFGTAFLPQNQDTTLATSTTPGATAYQTDLLRSYGGYAAISHRLFDGWRTYHSIQLSFNRRFSNGVSFGFNDTIALSDKAIAAARLQHNADGTYSFRDDQAQANEMLGDQAPQRHLLRANFVWDLPDLKASGSTLKAIGYVINDWQLSGIWSAQTGGSYTVSAAYQSGGGNVNLTGSPDYGARVYVIGDPGAGCSDDIYRQFNTSAFRGPNNGSVGLESGVGYLYGCFQSVLDLAVARNIRIGGSKNLQLRVDIFNAPNAGGITARNTSMSLANTTDPNTILNLPFDAQGNLLPNRVRPNQAGFGAVSGYQAPRSIQGQIRFTF